MNLIYSYQNDKVVTFWNDLKYCLGFLEEDLQNISFCVLKIHNRSLINDTGYDSNKAF